MDPIDEITADLSWRETELALLKVFIQRSDISRRQHDVLARAAWALLYAHYEGFAKFCLTLFFERAARKIATCEPLPHKMKSFALHDELKRMRNLPVSDFLASVESFATMALVQPPQFPEVDTKSNLWPEVLETLLELADLTCPSLDRNRNLLKALVGKRNGIAHGQSVSASYDDYVKQENAVYEVMYELAFQVDARLQTPPFAVVPQPA